MIDTDKLKTQFEDRLAMLSARVTKLEADLRAPRNPDSEERAQESEGDEVREGLEDSALSEIGKIQAALKRVEAGTYGTCAACGNAIDERRLAAVPYAARCIDCAAAPST